MLPREHEFADPRSLARSLAAAVADDLRSALTVRGAALLALPGGATPRLFLRELATQPLAWNHVTVTLTDERWLPPEAARSNAHLLRENLFIGVAATARFVPLYAATPTPEDALVKISSDIAALPLPFDAIVLGMGADGHCASLFAGADRLREALRPDGTARVLPMRAPGMAEPRMTLTLAALLNTRALYLHIEGAAKRHTLAAAQRGDAPFADAPIRAVLARARVAPCVFWCPQQERPSRSPS
jgi:6-phosphogluconolactonase